LFELISGISWKKYFKKNFPILIKATSVRSELTSIPAVQSIGKKAIIKTLI
jgi:23S rRNA G2445 N2-methylase RlmL